MKIALITDDGKSISKHFGRALYYLVVTIEDGQEISRERRDKLSHTHFSNELHEKGDGKDTPHGFSPLEQNRHFQMAIAISDCVVLICGGMGSGAYKNLSEGGIKPILTSINTIDEALQSYVEGQLVDHAAEMLH